MGLLDALQQRFPVTCRLVGEEFFRAMARPYVDEHRPRSPLLMNYGDDFPDFIRGFTPAADVSYLSDVARLEAAWSEAYHAADARPLPAQVLAGTLPDALLERRLTLHPSARLLRSVHPVADIWAAHQGPGAVAPPVRWEAQDVLIVRPDLEVQVHTLAPGEHAFVSALLERRCVQDAAEIALIGNSQFDAGRCIVNLFEIGAVVAIDTAHDGR